MSLRRHLYEIVTHASESDAENFPPYGKCHALTAETRLGLYIGYIDLRKYYKLSPLAFGVLAVPREFTVDPNAHVITGNYSQLFGGPGFACSIYSMQDKQTAGTACAQACMIMLLGMLADRGARLEGSFMLTQLGYSRDAMVPSDSKASIPGSLKSRLSGKVQDIERVFPASRGLSPSRIVHALNHLGINAEKVLVKHPLPGPPKDEAREALEKLTCRMLECYVQARYPVILGVTIGKWAGPKQPQSCPNERHGVTVVGVRSCSLQDRELQLILHDPAKQPFVERSASFCFEASWSPYEKGSAIVMIVPSEKAVRRSLPLFCLI